MNPTIKDVAKRAGVAVSTASYALNKDERIKKETREKILKAAEELGYFPSTAARMMKKKNSGVIGVFIISYSGPVVSVILDSLGKNLKRYNYDMLVISGSESSFKFLKEKYIDGAIILDSLLPDETFTEKINPSLPVLMLNRILEGKKIYTYTIENEELFYHLMLRLIKSGVKNPIFISGVEDTYDNIYRFKGFCRAIRQNGMELHYRKGDFEKKSGYTIAKKLFKEDVKYDAVVCANDEMALGVIDALNEHGIKINEQVKVTGFDNIELAKYYKPSLTTISVDRYSWGKLVAAQMVKIINNKNAERHLTIGGEIIVRESANI